MEKTNAIHSSQFTLIMLNISFFYHNKLFIKNQSRDKLACFRVRSA